MSAMAQELSQLMSTLTEEDYRTAISYVRFLAMNRKNTVNTTLRQIQGMFTDDKGWQSEEEMLAEMAAFRRSRIA